MLPGRSSAGGAVTARQTSWVQGVSLGYFALATATVYLQLLIAPPNVAVARSLGLALGALYLGLLARHFDPSAVVLPRWLHFAFWVWVAVGALGVALGHHWAVALIREIEWLVYAAIALLVAGLRAHHDRLAGYLLIAILTGVVVVIAQYAVLWFLLVDPRGHDWIWYPTPFIHLRHFGCFVAAGAVAALWPALFSGPDLRSGAARVTGYALFTLLVAAILWTGGRAALLATIIGTALVVGFAPPSPARRTLLRLLPFLVIAAGLLAEWFRTDNPNMGFSLTHGREVESIDTLASGRLAIWMDAWRAAIGSPLWGLGADGYGFLPGRADETAHPHNLLFQALTDWGFIGTAAFLAIVLYVLWTVFGRFRRAGKAGQPPLSLPLLVVFGVLASLGFNSLLDGPLYHYPKMALATIAFGLVLGHAGAVPDSGRSVAPRRGLAALATMALLVAGVQLFNISTVVAGLGGQSWSYYSARMMSLRAFPAYAVDVAAWSSRWEREEPHVLMPWLHWLQRNSRDAWRYYLIEADWYRRQGEQEAARQLTDQALRQAPRRTAQALREILSAETAATNSASSANGE
jgi:O-antigen ligase